MLQSPRIPELSQRDRFVKRVAAQRMVYVVAGAEGLGRVPSQRHRGREVTLFWTNRKAAERWADVVAAAPRIKEIALDALIGEVLPALHRMHRLAGPDWGAEPVEPELDAAELAERLKREVVEGFAERVRATRKVYLLEDGAGPAMVVSAVRSDTLVLPCWSERESAESRIEGPWADMLAVEIPLASFNERTLGWLDGRGFLVGPDHLVGPGTTELVPADLRRKLGP
jgi:hypothetical protein